MVNRETPEILATKELRDLPVKQASKDRQDFKVPREYRDLLEQLVHWVELV